ncbi:hypothetical protein EYF80_028790 [Liparis tanakae]|uniref:Uncharacterized protein n=1 Tax=Liparis tanakae TaxID=230148 RepID=A0A4Z2H8D0_9TELE|nr:hypothetical protein EYF80_028790 [Liparis tanakae]
MDQLAYKYMELCKVESSTDSDSEISPRWSDTSTLGCVSSTPESGTFRRTLPLTRTPAGRHGCYSLFLDPYDGSSEDSDESNLDVGVTSRQTRQQGKSGGGGGGCRFLGRRRRFLFHHPASVAFREMVKNGTRDPVTQPQQHLLDVQMKCGSDSELCVRDVAPSHRNRDGCRDLTEEPANDPTMLSQTTDIEMHCQFNDSGLNVTIPSTSHLPGPVTPVEGTLSQRLDSSSETTSPRPCNLRSIYKRKLGFPEADVGELGQRKRQRVVSMHDEPKEKDSASEPCLSRTTV